MVHFQVHTLGILLRSSEKLSQLFLKIIISKSFNNLKLTITNLLTSWLYFNHVCVHVISRYCLDTEWIDDS